MDDYSIKNLNESKNEWSIRLVNILTFYISEGFKSIFNESWMLCKKNKEREKYLMTFQNLISQIPKWNEYTVKEETNRIIENSNCNYLEDLITCVHIIQLKMLTCIRISNKNKKVDINIPSIELFIHNVYIKVARKLYSNIYLFERNISPLLIQKNNNEFESIIEKCILDCVRDNIPVDNILKAYLEEDEETIVFQSDKIDRNKIINEELEKKTLPNNIKTTIDSDTNIVIKDNNDENKDDKDNKDNKDNNDISPSQPIKLSEPVEVKIDTPINLNLEPPKELPTISKEPDFTQNIENTIVPIKDEIKPKVTNKLSFNDTITAIDDSGNFSNEPLIDLSRDNSFGSLNDSFNSFDDKIKISDKNEDIDLGIEIL